MKLIVGLGNIGEGWTLTRHNIGFMVIDTLAQRLGIRFRFEPQFKVLKAETSIEGEDVILLKPQTMMNCSGDPVRLIVSRLKIALQEILVLLDDIAIPFGSIRIRPKGSDGGHKGLRSIIENLETQNIPRMRIGILGKRNVKNYPKYVLNDFTKTEQKSLSDSLSIASEACEFWVKEGIESVMNKYNSVRHPIKRKKRRMFDYKD